MPVLRASEMAISGGTWRRILGQSHLSRCDIPILRNQVLCELAMFFLGFLDLCLSLVPTIEDHTSVFQLNIYVPYVTVVILVKSLAETHSKVLKNTYSKNIISSSNNAQCRLRAFNSSLTQCWPVQMETLCPWALSLCCVQILPSAKHAALWRGLLTCFFILCFSLDSYGLAGTEGMHFLQAPHQIRTSKKKRKKTSSLLAGCFEIGVNLKFPGQILTQADIYTIESKNPYNEYQDE